MAVLVNRFLEISEMVKSHAQMAMANLLIQQVTHQRPNQMHSPQEGEGKGSTGHLLY